MKESLMRDARIIWSVGKELPHYMSKDLLRLYHRLELPLMLVLDRMRRVGIDVDGTAARRERIQIIEEIAELEQLITDGEKINLMSSTGVFQLLMRRGVRFKSEFVYAVHKVTFLHPRSSSY